MMEDMIRKMADKIEANMFATICGGPRKQTQTALRVTPWGAFETVQLDDVGNVIEPCSKCGPVLLCHEHMALVT